MHSAGDPAPLEVLRQKLELMRRRLGELDALSREAGTLLEELSRAGGAAPERSGDPAREERGPPVERPLGAGPPAPPFEETSGDGTVGASPAGGPATLDEGQAALLVAVTMRGGTVPAEALSRLADQLGVGGAALERLFTGAEPHLVRRGGSLAGLSERGLESASVWRHVLPSEVLRRALEL